MEHRERTIAKFELDVLITEVLNPIEAIVIKRILEILANFMIVNNELMFEIYRVKYNEELKLKYLKKAVKEKLIAQYVKKENDKNVDYFYTLKRNTLYVLERANMGHNSIPYFFSLQYRNKLLNFNIFLKKLGRLDEEIHSGMASSLGLGKNVVITNKAIYYKSLSLEELERSTEKALMSARPMMPVSDNKNSVESYKRAMEQYLHIEEVLVNSDRIKIELDEADMIDFGADTTAVLPKNAK